MEELLKEDEESTEPEHLKGRRRMSAPVTRKPNPLLRPSQRAGAAGTEPSSPAKQGVFGRDVRTRATRPGTTSRDPKTP